MYIWFNCVYNVLSIQCCVFMGHKIRKPQVYPLKPDLHYECRSGCVGIFWIRLFVQASAQQDTNVCTWVCMQTHTQKYLLTQTNCKDIYVIISLDPFWRWAQTEHRSVLLFCYSLRLWKSIDVQDNYKDEFNERQINKNTYELNCAEVKY